MDANIADKNIASASSKSFKMISPKKPKAGFYNTLHTCKRHTEYYTVTF